MWSMTFTRTGLTVADFNDVSVNGSVGKNGFYSAAHIQGIADTACNDGRTDELCSSGWIAGDPNFPPSEVPLPAAAWLFLSGLIPLAGFLRKRREVLEV